MLAGGQNYPAITVTVNVANGAAASVTNQVSVSGGGSGGNSAGDVTIIGLESQTISFGTLGSLPFGSATFSVSATSSSGLTVSFASTTPLTCSISNNTTVTLLATGKCTIEATQAGNTNYSAATPVDQSFQVTQASQTISFGTLGSLPFGSAAFSVSATSSSGLTVSFASATSLTCSISNNTTVTLLATGKCTIEATQAGNTNYSAATPVDQSFQVIQASQTISFGTLGNLPFGSATFSVSATSSSGLTVSFASTTPLTCSISNNTTVTLLATGKCTVEATQGGNTNYSAATPVDQSFQVFDTCDIGHKGITTVADVQSMIDEALGSSPAINDLNGDGIINIADAQIVINDAVGLGCAFRSTRSGLSIRGTNR
jgi:N-acetylmuramic acid 6-phosphate (MurNAc-6-P) etherase